MSNNFTEAAQAAAEARYPDHWFDPSAEAAVEGFQIGAEWARVDGAAQDASDDAAVLARIAERSPAAVRHWQFAEEGRAAHGDEGCICTTCNLFAAVLPIIRERERAAAQDVVDGHESRQITIHYNRPQPPAPQVIAVRSPCPKCGSW